MIIIYMLVCKWSHLIFGGFSFFKQLEKKTYCYHLIIVKLENCGFRIYPFNLALSPLLISTLLCHVTTFLKNGRVFQCGMRIFAQRGETKSSLVLRMVSQANSLDFSAWHDHCLVIFFWQMALGPHCSLDLTFVFDLEPFPELLETCA